MSRNIGQWCRRTMIVGALFALSACAASTTNIDQKLAAGEQGVIIWAVETQTDASPSLAGAFVIGATNNQRYGLLPGIVPRPPDNAPSTHADSIVDMVNGKNSLDDFERNDNQVRWYAEPVNPGEFTLAFIWETARFAAVGFNRSFFNLGRHTYSWIET
jgi:hypothetical protein